MAATSSQPAAQQIPALDNSPHAADKASKEKKGHGKSTNTSEYPLEVRFFF